ncbi:aminopeptidase [Flavobacterium sp.]|uniref:aminopeptidase n=1 Tax=Flavobacterium sp. TaxID=239 RepID=UPI00262EF04F|nr:aminopeptidase [Flavobacterium sp.]
MRNSYTLLLLLVFSISPSIKAQHHSKLEVAVNWANKSLYVEQELLFFNDSNDTLKSIILNDWNHAYSDVSTPLGKRFSDEFYRGFHLAKKQERGGTFHLNIQDKDQTEMSWNRVHEKPDVIELKLTKPLLPHQTTLLQLSYTAKIPSDRFTGIGYTAKKMTLKNWFLSPARYENHHFIQNSNANLEDIANAICSYEVSLKVPLNFSVTSDMICAKTNRDNHSSSYFFSDKNRTDFNLFIEEKNSFTSYKSDFLEIQTNLNDYGIDPIKKAIIIDQIAHFARTSIGSFPHEKITVSQSDYEHNPFYGLNQLPSFVSPFSNEFIFELQFLKTFLNNYLKNSLRLNPREDNWIYDGIQVFTMMQYIDTFHPNSKMLGTIGKIKLLKSYNLINLDFNEQYSYFYMLMARKNLDQSLSDPKNTLLRFNEQIASKYRAGLSFRYLNDYLKEDVVPKSIATFFELNQQKQCNGSDLKTILTSNTSKNIDWFFETIISSRKLIDYKFDHVTHTKDSISFAIKSKTGVAVPMPIYGTKKGAIVFSKWLDIPKNPDTIYTMPRENADKIVLNFKDEVPEFNLRNNWKKLDGFFPNNRPIKFVFLKDLEDPYYNQVLYTPVLGFNVYDGFSPGMRFHNKTILNKPFTFDFSPMYSIKAQTFSGSGFFVINQNYRESRLYNVRYSLGASYFHYAPDATYLRLNPMIQMQIRGKDFRDNRKQLLVFRHVMVEREKSAIVADNSLLNYAVFNAKYINSKTEITNHLSFTTDLQLAKEFGKTSAEIEYRKLFHANRQLNIRLFVGRFLYNTSTDSNFFSYALDRPTDYLFDYNYYGRSESTGFFSRQFVMAEGGFKSKLNNPYANQWLTTCNASFNIWNWIELYGDVGFVKNRGAQAQFVYDSGVRLNLLTDYFELYFPMYSSNGWEISQAQYHQKIRFVVTFDPSKLISLFTRKWF